MNKPREVVTPKISELVVHSSVALYMSTLGGCPLTLKNFFLSSLSAVMMLIALLLFTAKPNCYWNHRDSSEFPVAPPIFTLFPPQLAPFTRRTQATFPRQRVKI